MPINKEFIESYLDKHENILRGGHPEGYIPKRNGVILGVSGVTVGTGVDLGQQTADGLRNYGVSPALIEKLRPYLGLKKEKAEAALRTQPLTLTQQEMQELNAAITSGYIKNTAQRYNNIASGAKAPRFEDAPKEIQAVAVSMEYQLGPGGARAFMQPLASGEWSRAANMLLNDKSAYANRRRDEGQTVMASIKNSGR